MQAAIPDLIPQGEHMTQLAHIYFRDNPDSHDKSTMLLYIQNIYYSSLSSLCSHHTLMVLSPSPVRSRKPVRSKVDA